MNRTASATSYSNFTDAPEDGGRSSDSGGEHMYAS